MSPQISASSSMSSQTKSASGRAVAMRSNASRNSVQVSHHAAHSATTVVVSSLQRAAIVLRSAAVAIMSAYGCQSANTPLRRTPSPRLFLGKAWRQRSAQRIVALASAAREIGKLVLADPADGEISRFGMRDVEARHRGGGQHGEALGDRHSQLARVEKVEERRLDGVIGARGITRRRTDPAVFLADQR